jgi:hypothetical protein
MTPAEEAAYVREVATQKTAALRMSLDAVQRQQMPFVGETGGGLGHGGASGRGDARGDTPAAVDRPPDRAGMPPDPTLADRLAEARRRADEHRDHGERRAPRPDKMQRCRRPRPRRTAEAPGRAGRFGRLLRDLRIRSGRHSAVRA